MSLFIIIIIIIIGFYIFVKYQMHSVLCKFRKLLTIQNTAV